MIFFLQLRFSAVVLRISVFSDPVHTQDGIRPTAPVLKRQETGQLVGCTAVVICMKPSHLNKYPTFVSGRCSVPANRVQLYYDGTVQASMCTSCGFVGLELSTFKSVKPKIIKSTVAITRTKSARSYSLTRLRATRTPSTHPWRRKLRTCSKHQLNIRKNINGPAIKRRFFVWIFPTLGSDMTASVV